MFSQDFRYKQKNYLCLYILSGRRNLIKSLLFTRRQNLVKKIEIIKILIMNIPLIRTILYVHCALINRNNTFGCSIRLYLGKCNVHSKLVIIVQANKNCFKT